MSVPVRVANLKAACFWLPAVVLLAFFAAGCAGAVEAPAPAASPPADTPTASALPPTITPAATSIPPTATPPATATTPLLQVCAPFPGYSRLDLLAAISNPFNPPPPGSDDPHQALDLAVVQAGMAMSGGPAHALLAGRVALVVRDRFPYGNAVMVETRLAGLPAGLLPPAAIPTPAPTLLPHPSLTCPAAGFAVASPDAGQRSLYLLYAHLEQAADLALGEAVTCGQRLGAVGQSGNALHPHLHIEARIGPAGARFSGMAHYEPRAVPAEMGNYCIWRVSNLFQLVDPTVLLEALP